MMKLSLKNKKFELSLGARGEMIAFGFLKDKGYKILEKNYTCRLGEIDAIIRDRHTIVFVEIKTRKSDHFGRPEEAVHLYKQRKIIKVAHWYLKEKRMEDVAVAFAVVAISWNEGEPEVRFIPNAFDASS